MRWSIDENKGDLLYEVEDDRLILKIKPEVIASINTPITGGTGSGSSFYHITLNDQVRPSDNNGFTALRTLKEIDDAMGNVLVEANDMFLRKDIDDVAHGNIYFDKNIGSSIFINDWDGKGWEITEIGAGTFDSGRIRSDLYIGNRLGSPTFASGFPNGFGWDLAPYKRYNAAEIEEVKWRLELDDLIVRGKLRVYEMIISQLRGENDNFIFAGQMEVAYYDEVTQRIYFDTGKGKLYNPFRSGDILMMQRFDGMPTVENDYQVIKQYELQVVDVGIGPLSDGEDRLDWITFKNFVGSLSDIANGDILTRADSVTDSTRKGIVKITTIDEIGAPYMDVVYGMKTNPMDNIKARFGNLTGIRTKSGIDLTDQWGLYAKGAFIENSIVLLENGDTIEQNFVAMNGKFESLINGIRNDMSTEGGNILVNSSFSQNTNYWTSANTAHFINVSGEYLWVDGSFYVEKDAVADIFNDNGKNVLRIRNTYILQQNSIMRLPEHTETPEDGYTYSFALFYKVIRPGTLSVGVPGTGLYTEEQLTISDSYKKLSKVAKWNETGDFKIQFTGEILIYGVSLFNDETADALIHMQTQILQTLDAIKLLASKDYVDAETGKIYTKYNAELSVMAQEISARVTQQQLNTATGAVERELSGLISIQAGQISAVSSEVDTINNTIKNAGWITTTDSNTLFARKDSIISVINQSSEITKILSSKVAFYAYNLNMIRNSGNITNTTYWKVTGASSLDVSNGAIMLNLNIDTSNYWGDIKNYSLAGIRLSSDKKYTVSFRISSSVSQQISIMIGPDGNRLTKNLSIPSGVSKNEFTFQGKDVDAEFFRLYSQTRSVIYIYQVKLEEGEYATEWTPNPNDSIYSTDSDLIAAINGTTISGGLQLTTRIKLGLLSGNVWSEQGGISANTDNIMLWAGGTYEQAKSGIAKTILYHDGSGRYTGRIETSSAGNRIIIDPSAKAMQMINTEGSLITELKFNNIAGYQSNPALHMYLRSTNNGNTIYRYTMDYNGFGVYDPSGNILSRLGPGFLLLKEIPTIDPKQAGRVWRDNTTLKISVG